VPAPQKLLRGVDVHHRDPAPERARQAARFDHAADGEDAWTVHGLHRKFATDLKPLLIRERPGHDQRTGQCEERQRIGKHVARSLWILIQIIVAEFAIARDGDAKQQQTTRAVGDRSLDHWRSRPHLAHAPHFVEHVFVEPRLARRNLNLRAPRDLIDRLMKRRQHALIRRVHPGENAHAQHDSRYREQHSQQMLLRVRPTN
jgi:hypothetical protein